MNQNRIIVWCIGTTGHYVQERKRIWNGICSGSRASEASPYCRINHHKPNSITRRINHHHKPNRNIKSNRKPNLIKNRKLYRIRSLKYCMNGLIHFPMQIKQDRWLASTAPIHKGSLRSPQTLGGGYGGT